MEGSKNQALNLHKIFQQKVEYDRGTQHVVFLCFYIPYYILMPFASANSVEKE